MESNSDCEENDIPIWQEPRCEPLGATKEALCDEHTSEPAPEDRLHALEEEQEILSSSVFSLTSHLAQIEFRLRQIINTPPEKRDEMLKALEEYTVRACGATDSRAAPQGSSGDLSCGECAEYEHKIKKQRTRISDFMQRLKTQLIELDQFSSNVANVDPTTHMSLIQNLQTQLNHSFKEGYSKPQTAEELTQQMNSAIHQYSDKQLSKDEIINKLQTHIEEMQQFINIMKGPEQLDTTNENKKSEKFEKTLNGNKVKEDLRGETIDLMRRASNMMQIVAVSHFGCSLDSNRRYERKSASTVTHWGNLRAKLEMSIDAVLRIVSRARPPQSIIDNYDSDSEDDNIIVHDAPLTTTVRKHLAVNLRDLLQHGLAEPESNSLVPIIGCFPIRRSSSSRSMHIWELILRYYELNDGDRFNSTPARKLSQSFNLDIVGGTAITNKQSLLSTIESIVASHTRYKRSYDAHFKAFVCAALNAHKLVLWLNIILKCRSLIDSHYSSTSYVVNTGFQDTLQSLDRLTQHHFDLPVDLAVKQFQNIKDVFM